MLKGLKFRRDTKDGVWHIFVPNRQRCQCGQINLRKDAMYRNRHRLDTRPTIDNISRACYSSFIDNCSFLRRAYEFLTL